MTAEEKYPFAAYYGVLRAAVAARGRVVADVVCSECDRRAARVYDTPNGAVYHAVVALPSHRWMVEESKMASGHRAPYATATSSGLVEWTGERPPRWVTADCPGHGALDISLDALTQAAAAYRSTSKKQRVRVSPSEHGVLR